MASIILCSKVPYANEKTAVYAIGLLNKTSLFSDVPKRAYECPHCGYWHITKSTLTYNCKPKLVNHARFIMREAEFWVPRLNAKKAAGPKKMRY